MKNLLVIAFLALMMLTASSALVLADEDEDGENEGQNEDEENENQVPGFEAVLAFACSLAAARLLGKAS
jgi:hypothetical protein